MTKDDAMQIMKTVEIMYRNSEKLSKDFCSVLMDKTLILNMFDGEEHERKRGENMLKSMVFRIYEKVMDSYDNQYQLAYSMGNPNRDVREKEAITNIFLEESKYIDIASDDETLYVRLPRVPARYYRRTKLFVKQIRDKLCVLQSKNKIPAIPNKVVRVLNVFPTPFDDRNIPDNDNYDLKAIVDTLTDALGGGDFGLTCSFCYDAVKDDKVLGGTYIIISKSKHGIKSADEILNTLKRVFEYENDANTGK